MGELAEFKFLNFDRRNILSRHSSALRTAISSENVSPICSLSPRGSTLRNPIPPVTTLPPIPPAPAESSSLSVPPPAIIGGLLRRWSSTGAVPTNSPAALRLRDLDRSVEPPLRSIRSSPASTVSTTDAENSASEDSMPRSRDSSG